MATSRYYMTPEEREQYEKNKLFQSIIAIGQKNPGYALGLAIGSGLGNAYVENNNAKQEAKLDDYVNSQLSPSTLVQMQDEAIKQMVQPDPEKEISLQNAKMGVADPIQVSVPQQEGFTAPSQSDISAYARANGISNKILNNRMGTYQQQIQERAREHYVPRISSMVENGALQSNEGIAQLSAALNEYGQYDPTAAKNVTSGIAALAKAVGTPKGTARTTSVAAAHNTNSGTAGGKTATGPTLSDLTSLRKQFAGEYKDALASEDETRIAAAAERLNKLDERINGVLYPVKTGIAELAEDIQESTPLTDPDAYETKTYEQYAKEMGVKDIANLGRPLTATEPKKAEPTKVEQQTQGDNSVNWKGQNSNSDNAKLQQQAESLKGRYSASDIKKLYEMGKIPENLYQMTLK